MTLPQSDIKNNKRYRLLKFILIASIIEGFVLIAATLAIPSDPKNAFFLGYSLNRLLIIGISIIILAFFLFLLFKSKKVFHWLDGRFTSERDQFFFTLVSILSALALWMIIWISSAYFGKFEPIFIRLKYILIWLATIFSQFSLYIRIRTRSTNDREKLQKTDLKVFLLFSIFFCLLWLVISVTKVGLIKETAFWNVPGIPLSGFQFFFILLLIIATPLFESSVIGKHKKITKILTYLTPLIIYIVAAVIWGTSPMLKHYFSLEQTPPNYQPYPYNDARVHDLGGISILKGEGIYFRGYTDKPLYMTFLAFLHLFAGNDYHMLSWLQVLVFSLIPVLLYYFCKHFNSYFFGIVLAFIMIFQQRNATILAHKIASANPKLLVTEVFMLFGIVFVTYYLFLWMKEKQDKHILILGASIGSLMLVRINPVFILPTIMVIAFFMLRKKPKLFFKQILLLILGFSMVFSPWLISGANQEGKSWFFIKLKDVIQMRYTTFENNTSQINFAEYLSISSYQNAKMSSFSTENNSSRYLFKPIANTGKFEQAKLDGVESNKVLSVAGLMANHFLHNFSTSLLILPDSLKISTLDELSAREYWQDDKTWNGSFEPIQYIFIFINLIIIAIGITKSWKLYRWAGFAPIFVFVAYDLSLALAMTSGSRYIIPINWIVFFYYILGVIYLVRISMNYLGIQWKPNANQTKGPLEINPQPQKWRVYKTILPIILIASIVPFVNSILPVIMPADQNKTFESLPQQPDAPLIQGQMLYPYYNHEKHIIIFDFLLDNVPYTYSIAMENLIDPAIILESDVPAALRFKENNVQQELLQVYLISGDKLNLIWDSGMKTP